MEEPATRRVGVEEVIPMTRTKPKAATESPAAPILANPEPRKPEAMDVILAAFGALGYALSARALLLLCLMGAFVLAMSAMNGPEFRIWVLIAYCGLTVLPIVGLELLKKRN